MASATETIALPRRQTGPATARHRNALRIWLAVIALMLVAMIVVGGATRLTHSGLSITKWQPIVGMVPPLTHKQWETAFKSYQQIPEFKEINPTMDLAGFKHIYWWEWAHRFLGRMIGFVFFIPFLAFWIAGYIPRGLWPKLLALFALGGIQGFVGWYMVESGLEVRTDVSQYRLTAHFGIAIVIFGFCLWLIFGLSGKQRLPIRSGAAKWLAGIVVALVYLQILLGALMSGTDAGFTYNTWPLILGHVIPPGLYDAHPWFKAMFTSQLTVQFDHRMMAYCLVLLIWGQAAWLAWSRQPPLLAGSGLVLGFIILLQATLGVWTLLLAVPIELGLAHQLGAVILFGAALFHFWLATNGVPAEPPESLGPGQIAAKA
jgi:heme a synthase